MAEALQYRTRVLDLQGGWERSEGRLSVRHRETVSDHLCVFHGLKPTYTVEEEMR